MKTPFKLKGWSPFTQKSSELPEGVDEPKSILGSEAGGAGYERGMKTETGSGSPTDDMSRTHNYVHKYEPGKPKTKANLLPGYPKWVEKT